MNIKFGLKKKDKDIDVSGVNVVESPISVRVQAKVSNILLSGGQFYKVEDFFIQHLRAEEINVDEMLYNLIISDEYFLYLNLSITARNKKQEAIMARNLLELDYGIGRNFDVFVQKVAGVVVAGVVNEKLDDTMEDFPRIFAKAKRITTPFLEIFGINNNINYKTGISNELFHRYYDSDSGEADNNIDTVKNYFVSENHEIFIRNEVSNDGLILENSFVEWLKNGEHRLMQKIEVFPGVIKEHTIFYELIPTMIFMSFLYLLFVFLHAISYVDVNNLSKQYDREIRAVYMGAGVGNSQTPLHDLTVKVNRVSSSQRNLLVVLNDIGVANTTIHVTSLSVRSSYVNIVGVSNDIGAIDSYEEDLKKKHYRKVEVLRRQTNKDGLTDFTIKVTL